MKLSIIIPIYNPLIEDLKRCLDSMYSQNNDFEDFEVICVDDCSPNENAANFIKEYKIEDKHPANLIYHRHVKNTRQGGARNTGFRIANGEYLGCIDQDDFFLPGGIEAMLEATSKHTDMVMFDFATSKEDCKITTPNYYKQKNSTQLYSGEDFLNNQEVAWLPWIYIYRKDFILSNNFRFEENVRFEDVDFVLECVANAKTIFFEPISIACHRMTSIQTTAVGNNRNLNIDLVKLAYRVGEATDRLNGSGLGSWRYVEHHHSFLYKAVLKKNIWRLPYSDISTCLKNYPPSLLSASRVLKFVRKNPTLSALFFKSISPFLHSLYFLYRKLKS